MANRFELAHDTWPILIQAAQEGTTLTYGQVAHLLHYRGARVVGTALWPIQDLCMERGWPPLTSLVVNQDTDQPGPGFIAWPGDLQGAHESVFAFPWHELPVPFPPEYMTNLEQLQLQPTRTQTQHAYAVPDREVHINGRGPYQSAFREILLGAYRNQCALCDTKMVDILVASHIVPWALDRNNRLNPRNGLLLCRNHDGLFESGCVMISVDYDVTIADLNVHEIGADLYAFLTEHTRSQLRLPSHGFEPDPQFLQWRLGRQRLAHDPNE